MVHTCETLKSQVLDATVGGTALERRTDQSADGARQERMNPVELVESSLRAGPGLLCDLSLVDSFVVRLERTSTRQILKTTTTGIKASTFLQ